MSTTFQLRELKGAATGHYRLDSAELTSSAVAGLPLVSVQGGAALGSVQAPGGDTVLWAKLLGFGGVPVAGVPAVRVVADQPSVALAPNTDSAAAAQAAAIAAAATDATSKVAAEATARTSAITAAITALVNGAPGALDTLNELAVALTADEGAATTLATLVGTKMPVVVHGSTASTARPTSSVPVLWLGSVTPTNAVANDLLVDTATPAFKVRGASAFTLVGGTSLTLTDKGAWATTTAYVVGDTVTQSRVRYICATAHTSGTFATDLAAGKWDPASLSLSKADVLGTGLSAADLGAIQTIVTALEGRSAYCFGHSYTTGTGASPAITGGAKGWVQRLARRTGLGDAALLGVGGAQMADAATNQTRNWSALSGPVTGVMFMECCYNDAASANTANSQARDGFVQSLRAWLAIVRSSSQVAYSSAAWTFTGTWSTVADTDSSTLGGGVKQTATQGDTATVVVQGSELTLLLMGLDDTAYGSAGGTVSVSCDGVSVQTGLSLSNRMKTTGAGRKRTYIPVRITGLNNGYHTITITKTDATTNIVQVAAVVSKAASYATPYAVLLKDPPTIAVTSGLTYYNGALDTIAAEFDRTSVVSVPADWDATTMVASDGIHPNDKGHESLLVNTFAAALTLPDVSGISSVSITDITPAVTAAADTYVRADSASTLGSTSTGALPYEVLTPGMLWGISSNQAAPQASKAYAGVGVTDGRSDGTITWTLGNTNVALGLLFRCTKASAVNGNYTGFVITQSAIFYGTPGSFASVTLDSGAIPAFSAGAAGDVWSVVLLGTSITVKKNGATIATATSSNNQSATYKGHASNVSTTPRVSAFSCGA